MVKKKQADFQPTKLRVGKRLPKGRNVTNTAFKSKKIIANDQKLKIPSKDVPLSELFALLKNKNVSGKIDCLKKIRRYIEKNIFTLPSYFSDILKAVGNMLLVDHPKVRQETRELLIGCLHPLSISQMNCFINTLTSYLDCMMTHIDFSIRRDSLDLLSAILKTHPTLICYSTKLLGNLLNMISSVRHKKGESLTQRKRKLDDNINSSITSVEWRDQVLKLIVEFLQNLVDNFSKQKKSPEDEQEVYWDGKRPLYVPLYARSGLTPAKLECYSPGQIKSEATITKELRSFFDDLVNVLSDVVTEEIASLTVSSGCNLLKFEHIQHLNTVAQVFCFLGDWYKFCTNIDNNEDPDFLLLMNKLVSEKLMKRFPYALHDSTFRKSGRKAREETCRHLNLGIGYLYSTFIFGTGWGGTVKDKLVLICVCDALTLGSNLDTKSVSLVLKITYNLISCSSCTGKEPVLYSEEISGIIDALCRIHESIKDKKAMKELQSFFLEIALNYDYKFLLNYDGMKQCLKHIFHEMKRMEINKETDKKVLKCINQICTREYPAFIDILNNTNPLEILDYLKFEDENFQFSAMNLITHMTNLSPEFMQDIADFILYDHYLSPKTVVKFIRQLHNRFQDPRVSPAEHLEFVKFLFNVACDIVSIDKAAKESGEVGQITIADIRSLRVEPIDNTGEDHDGENEKCKQAGLQKLVLNEDVFKTLTIDIQSICVYRIIPSHPNSERHLEVFKVCLECLLLYPEQDFIIQCASDFFKELSHSKIYFPVHCAVALRKIADHFYKRQVDDGEECYASSFADEMTVSSLFYISILTNEFSEEKLKSLGIRELLNVMSLNTETALNALDLIFPKIYYKEMNEKLGLHVLRILKFLLAKQMIEGHHIHNLVPILQTLENYCADNSQEQAILFELYEVAQFLVSQ